MITLHNFGSVLGRPLNTSFGLSQLSYMVMALGSLNTINSVVGWKKTDSFRIFKE